MSKANVLHVIDTLRVGGAEKLLVGTVNSLPQFNHHVVTLCGSGELVNQLPADCKLFDLGFKSKWDTYKSISRLRSYIRRHDIDIVHSHLVMSTIIARLACPANVPLFNSIHSLLGQRCFAKGNRVQRFIERATYRKRHHVLAVSEEVRKDYDKSIGIKGANTVLPNFVDDRFFTSSFKRMSFNGTFRMVTVGTLKPAKNYSYMIEAFRHLPKGIHLDIYGDGPLKQQLQADIDKYQLNIRLLGSSNNVHELLHRYDMFVMSSIFEGQPVALLEAMASGMPVLVSDIPVLREATHNNALFCDLSNPADFVNKVKAIANHEVDLDPFAEYNFNLVRNCARKDQYMQKLADIYWTAQSNSHKEGTTRQTPVLVPGQLQTQYSG